MSNNSKQYTPRATNIDGHNESDLIRLIIAFMSKNGYKVWRHQNTGRIDEDEAATKIESYIANLAASKTEISKETVNKQVKQILKNSYKATTGTQRGVPDLVGYNISTAKQISLEVKINTDKLSKEQIKFRDELLEAGGEWYEVRTYNGFLKQFYLKKNNTAPKKIDTNLFSMPVPQ